MIQEIAPDFFRIEIPLPDAQLKNVNSYVIRGPRNLIIDTGWYDEECLKVMQKSLQRLSIDLSETDFFITHHHADHIGVAILLNNPQSAIFMSEPEATRVNEIGAGQLTEEVSGFLLASGFPDGDIENIVPPVVVEWYGAGTSLPFKFVEDGAAFPVADYHFTCVATPGHSLGHMCLYDQDRRLLIAGDHLLGDITPSVQARLDGRNSLKEYLTSLEKISRLPVDTVLPGHRNAFSNHGERIREIEEHHYRRNAEVLSILRNGSKSAYRVASRMSWNIGCDSWGSFPILHSFFATGEAFAHLTYLESEGDVQKEMEGPLAVYSLAK
jgi:glyoxylase-like metal-dependent hydrolase (beta-lactamase superfamily II)